MGRRRRRDLDDVDRELCRLLIAEPRANLRDLAARTGITNETVTARLRRLREADVLATTVAIDWVAAGYKAGAMIRIKAPYQARVALGERFAETPSAQFVGVATGACDLVVALLGEDLSELRTTLRSAIHGLDNVSVIAVDVVTSVLAYDVNTLTLPIQPWSPDALPSPEPPLDDLDRALIQEFALAGHESNREIARRLNVSDATVRSRIRRLESGGLVRLVAGIDPISAGERRLAAAIFMSLDDESAVLPLAKHSLVTAALTTIGPADVMVQVTARSGHELSQFVTQEVATIDNVRNIEVAHLSDVVVHRNHLVRFVSDS